MLNFLKKGNILILCELFISIRKIREGAKLLAENFLEMGE